MFLKTYLVIIESYPKKIQSDNEKCKSTKQFWHGDVRSGLVFSVFRPRYFELLKNEFMLKNILCLCQKVSVFDAFLLCYIIVFFV
jgi:hypothetical protein